MYYRSFTVEGFGEFPFDMLRYDQCYPCTSDDVWAMLDKGKRRQVRLSSRFETKWQAEMYPTGARWHSFNWDVIETEPARKA